MGAEWGRGEFGRAERVGVVVGLDHVVAVMVKD